jgi:hypothetical protein
MNPEKINTLAAAYGLSVGAVMALAAALQHGGGKMAQFNHPELGGLGQWMPGMIMIGDIFNSALKAKIEGVCCALAADLPPAAAAPLTLTPAAAWYPRDLGQPAMVGEQNQTAYAYFPDQQRLAIRQGATMTLYDTRPYQIQGFSAQNEQLRLHTDQGLRSLGDLQKL